MLFSLKENEILIHSATWMKLENMINEISQTQNDRYYMIPLIYEVPRIGKLIKPESKIKATKSCRKSKGEVIIKWIEFLFWMMNKFWNWILIMV